MNAHRKVLNPDQNMSILKLMKNSIKHSMRLLIINESEMSKGLDEQIRKGLCICFPDDMNVFSSTRAWHGSAPAWSVVVEESDRIIAHCGIVDRIIKVDIECIHIAGIQNVFVVPDYRRQGLCEMVMNKAMEEAQVRDYHGGLLFCIPQLEKIYTRCGWKTIPREKIFRIDAQGQRIQIPEKNIAMFYPLMRTHLPEGIISLEGNDW